jgi:DNA-binding CsgD family transcriptional regulator
VLLGRRAETGQIDALLGGARAGQGGALVISGEPGVGKTALVGYAALAGNDMRTLQASGTESESDLPYSGLADLVRPILGCREALPTWQRAALEGALAIGAPAGGERFAVQLAALGLLERAGESGPLLALVDDLQWIDRATTSALFFIARRLGGAPVALVLAARTDSQVAGSERVPELRVGGLDLEGSRELLSTRSGTIVPQRVAARLHAETRGNPLALMELTALLTRAQLEGRAQLPDPLPLGEDLAIAFAAVLDALPDETVRALTVVAAVDRDDVAAVASALATLDISAAALAPAEAAGVLVRSAETLSFRHPLLRAAAYQRASTEERRRAHRALAGALSHPADRDRYAWHLAASAAMPDEAIAAELEQAAERARQRGSQPAAATALERAARLTPDPAQRAVRLVDAAALWEQSGVPERALSVAHEVSTMDARLEARRIHVVGRVTMWRGRPDDARDLLVAAAREIETVDPLDAAGILIDAAFACQMSGDCGRALDIARRADGLVGTDSGPLRLACDWAVSQALCMVGETHEALRIARGVVQGARALPTHIGQPLLANVAMVLNSCGEHLAGRELATLAIARAREHGLLNLLPYTLACLSLIEFQTGQWLHAYAAASESFELARELTLESQASFSLLCLAWVQASLGREVEARAHIEQALAVVERSGAQSLASLASTIVGQLEMSRGRPDAAVVPLERADSLVRRWRMRQPIVTPRQPDYIEALLQLGRRADALRVLAEFDDDVDASDSAWGRATAARCHAMLATGGDVEPLFMRVLELHDASPTPFERARTELRFGEALRRDRRPTDARVHLHAALDEFERLGARLWAGQARSALAAAGERVAPRQEPQLADLTPQEMQICLAVAEGATNREVAARFFLSPKTIETHLTNAYRKIGVRSRTELARLVARATTGSGAGLGPVSSAV